MDLDPSMSEEILNRLSNSLKSPERNSRCEQRCERRHEKGSRVSSPGGTSRNSYEVFRNNTTAVEVIVKEVPNKFNINQLNNLNKKTKAVLEIKDNKVRSLEEELEMLKIEVNKANFKLVATRKGFGNVINELKKQIEVVNKRDYDEQAKNLRLKLENEKLKALLESKTNLIAKLKKEVLNIKHTLKYVVKGICSAPQLPESYTFNNSDAEYDDFEKGLKKDYRVRITSNLLNNSGGCVTFDSTMSKDISF